MTKSPLGSLIDKGAAALNLYKYGRKPFIFFAVGIGITLLALQVLQALPFVHGVNPSNPEWKESFAQLHQRTAFLFRSLVYAGAFVLGVSQAVKKQADIFNPDITYTVMYGKLVLVLFALEFLCNLVLSPRKTKSGESEAVAAGSPMLSAVLQWIRALARDTSEQMIAGAAAGFGYGYLVRGAGVLFKAY